jgi:hypothetical protein
VYWLSTTPAPVVIPQRAPIMPQFSVRGLRLPAYGPTGTPADQAGAVQCFAVAGRA